MCMSGWEVNFSVDEAISKDSVTLERYAHMSREDMTHCPASSQATSNAAAPTLGMHLLAFVSSYYRYSACK